MTLYDELVARGLIAQVTDEAEIKDLINNGKATFYIGFDPTADSLHVGHFMALCLMKRLQMAGNKPIALIGGGTAMIGDPSGRTDMRQMMTPETIQHNCDCFKKQMSRFIDFSDTGSAVALVTPFNEDNTPNFEKIKELVEYHIANGTDAIVATGTTGEASTMTDEEQLDVIKCIVDTVNKRIPVIAGASTNDTRHSLSLAKGAQDMGADALLIITPYYNKANRTGLKAHFKAIADAVDLPIILYNVPSRTGVNIAPDLVAELANECENIVAIKEASGDIAQVAEVARLVPDDFAIYSGNDDSITPLLSSGW